jgi:hypothetical protein
MQDMYCISPTRTTGGQSGSSGQKKGETIAPEIERIDHEREERMYSCLQKEDHPRFSSLIRSMADSSRETPEKTEG